MSDPDAVSAVTALMALITDPKAAKARLDALQKAAAEAETAQAKLDAARAVHDQTVAALEAREIAVTERERIVAAEEQEYWRQQPKERFPLGANGDTIIRRRTLCHRQAGPMQTGGHSVSK
jgi:prophage DNA circulation protein